jgi:hypothetical protein
MARPHPTRIALVLVASLASLVGCSKAPAEPEGRPASSATPAPAVLPLTWAAPGSWTKLNDPPRGPLKMTYRLGKVGNDKEEAEVAVYFYGTGALGDPEARFKEWSKQFDAGATEKRESQEIKGLKVETLEILGTYKIALTPPAKGRKQPPVAMVKSGWRLYGAVVKTPDRGNWFFKMAGPDETVQSSKSSFRAMLETLK